MMKKIRIDFYRYLVRRGRASIFLQKAEDFETYQIPHHYVTKDENLADEGYLRQYELRLHQMEDDGDLVFINCSLNESHVNRRNPGWISLAEITNLSFSPGDSMHIRRNILLTFLDLCPNTESKLRERTEAALDKLLIEQAKMSYIGELRRVLDGDNKKFADEFVSRPSPELVKSEMETLEHFELRKSPKCNYRSSCNDWRDKRYSYKPIDWESLGAEFRPVRIDTLFDDYLDSPTEEF